MKYEAHRFRALDGWRGVCALLVALFHLQTNGYLASLAPVRNAWLFVDFFFVLSGFVVTYAYAGELSTFGQIKSFVRRRFARLWPLHMTVLAAFVGLEIFRFIQTGLGFTGERSFFAILTNVFLIQSLGVHDTLTWNTPAWSISTEFYTYLIFAAVCAISTTARLRVVASCALAAIGLAALVFISDLGMRETFHWGIARCVYGFFLGSLVYETWQRKWLAALAGSASETIVIAVVAFYIAHVSGNTALEYLAPPLFGVVILVFAEERGALSQLMSSRGATALGRWSYSIYMIHMLIIALLFSALDRMGRWTLMLPDGTETIVMTNKFASDSLTLAYLVFVVGISAASWRFIECPAQSPFSHSGNGATL